jgi:ArsR family transcriptional regulator
MSRRELLLVATKLPRCRPGVPILPHPLPAELAHVAQWFFAASDVTRLHILALLSQRERCVTELSQILGAPQSSVSFHLKVLKASGLVSEHRDGRWKYYGLRGDTLEHMIAFTRIVGPGRIGAHARCPVARLPEVLRRSRQL